MRENDKSLIIAADLSHAIGLLTRLPLRPVPFDETRPIAASAWAWPLIGAGLGLIGGLIGLVLASMGAGPGICAGVTLAAMMMLTGALHEDGLADSVDGLWGGQETSRRLEIMKDSRVGSYGVLALTLSVLLRWSALATLFHAGWVLAPLIAVGALSRLPMTILMASLPNARTSGLAVSTGRPESQTIVLGAAIALIGSLFIIGSAVIPVAFWIALITIPMAVLAKAKIGGQTGDILGASQQLAEIAALASLAAMAT
ncbi:MAG: adenosylcobinamide-GDP ribazoletransferase [Rhodobacteraceae bacterium]|nr:adenosylcobinamide-GDP ribazoletransferase [Paracoccaceae bacterium]